MIGEFKYKLPTFTIIDHGPTFPKEEEEVPDELKPFKYVSSCFLISKYLSLNFTFSSQHFLDPTFGTNYFDKGGKIKDAEVEEEEALRHAKANNIIETVFSKSAKAINAEAADRHATIEKNVAKRMKAHGELVELSQKRFEEENWTGEELATSTEMTQEEEEKIFHSLEDAYQILAKANKTLDPNINYTIVLEDRIVKKEGVINYVEDRDYYKNKRNRSFQIGDARDDHKYRLKPYEHKYDDPIKHLEEEFREQGNMLWEEDQIAKKSRSRAQLIHYSINMVTQMIEEGKREAAEESIRNPKS